MKNRDISIVALIAVFGLTAGALAGSLTPPGAVSSTMNSLEDLYASIAGTFDSTSVVANQNGSLLENLKYIESQSAWASSSNDIWNLNSGNVGIGTTTPNDDLTFGATDSGITLDTSDGSDNKILALSGGGEVENSGRGAHINMYGNEHPDHPGRLELAAGETSAITFHIGSDGIEVARIDASGNVGIGTTSPTAKLAVRDQATVTGGELVTNSTFTGSAAGWTLGSDVAYSSNHVTSTYAGGDPSLSTDFSTVAGTTYLLTFTISGSNTLTTFYFSNNGISNIDMGPFNGDGTYTIAFTTDFTGTETITFDDRFPYQIGDTWTLDNVSIQEGSVGSAFRVLGYDNNTWLELGSDLYGNTALGKAALSSNTTGGHNNAIGMRALSFNTTGDSNTAVGNGALLLNTTGSYNNAIGELALYANTTGAFNNALGYFALSNNTTGIGNVAVGHGALLNNTTGSTDIAIGIQSLTQNTTGTQNIAIGSQALLSNTSGNYNNALGLEALNSNSTGVYNIALGPKALRSNTVGTYNSAVGAGALRAVVGSDNIAVGASAGYSALGSGNVFLGRSGGYDEHGSNTLWIENSNAASSSALIYGEFDSDYLSFGANVSINGQLDVAGPIEFNIASSSGVTDSFALCHNVNGNSNNQELLDCGNAPVADYMEMYPMDTSVSEGDIVMASDHLIHTINDQGTVPELVKADDRNRAFGIVSVLAHAGDFNSIGYNIPESAHPMPLALVGRVNVHVSMENGPISAGDPIALSSVPGIGAKATTAGFIIGRSLEPAQTDGSVLVFVSPGYWAPSVPVVAVASGGSSWLPDFSGLFSMIIDAFKNLLGISFEQGKVKANELCAGNVCVNEDQLQQLLNAAGVQDSISPTPDATPAPSDTPEPTPDTTPEPTP